MYEALYKPLPDCAAYAQRIGVSWPITPNLSTLDEILFQHQCNVPFENLESYALGRVPSLEIPALFDKVVTRRRGGYAVVMASRPYHNDPLVNHGIPKLFSSQGIAVLTPDGDMLGLFYVQIGSFREQVRATNLADFMRTRGYGCRIARHVQIVAVSHLAQIASFADREFVIEKEETDGRTFTRIREAEGDARVDEIARLIGGDRGEAARRHAEELLQTASAYKNSLS